jgi:hypothetical protein
MDHSELAWEFADLFGELSAEHINQILAINVPFDTLAFFNEYAESFGKTASLDADTSGRLPNLMLLGYLLRVLEDRLLDEPSDPSGPC